MRSTSAGSSRQRPAAAAASSADAGRVADQVRRGEVGEVTHGAKGTVDGLALQGQPRARLGGERLLPGGAVLAGGEELRGLVGEHRRDGRVERAPGPLADHRGGELVAAEHSLEGGVAGHVDDAHGQGDLLAPGATRLALAVPPLSDMREQSSHGRGEAEPVGQHLRHLAERGDVALEHPGRPGSPRTIWRARTVAGLPESASTRRNPAVISPGDPNLDGMACLVRASSSPNSSAATSASAVQPT
jgi:hypothetical protein